MHIVYFKPMIVIIYWINKYRTLTSSSIDFFTLISSSFKKGKENREK